MVAIVSWKSYYWDFFKEFGKECYRTWRGEMFASVLVIAFIFLINRASIDLRVGLLASGYTLATLASLHFLRTPWLLQRREERLPAAWGILGMAVGLASVVLWLYSAAWFYTSQPRVVIYPKTPDSRDIEIYGLRQQLASLREPEAPDSLRRRTMKLADEWTAYLMKKLSDKDKPPDAFPNSANPNPSEEQQKAIQKSQEFYRGIDQYYVAHFRGRFIGIVEEYKNVGVDVHFLDSAFAQFTPYLPPVGSVGEDNSILHLFRELAYHVDAKGHLIVL